MHEVLAHILNCGYLDVQFLFDEITSYDVDFHDLDFSGGDLNGVLSQVYKIALCHYGIDENNYDINIYTNCLDSHLYVNNEPIHSSEDLKRIYEKKESKI